MDLDVKFINPFVMSVHELFTNMLEAKAERVDLSVQKTPPVVRDITATIGISGKVKGTVALNIPSETALKMVEKLLYMELEEVDDTVMDGVAEILNVIAGSAKAKLNEELGEVHDLSLPTIVRGTDFVIHHPSAATWIKIDFKSDLGPFTLQVTFDTVAEVSKKS